MIDAERARRYGRQILLLGEEGQAALGQAAARVGGAGAAHEIATTYARAAGFSEVIDGSFDRDTLAPADLVGFEAARDVLAGARAALAEIVHATESTCEAAVLARPHASPEPRNGTEPNDVEAS